MISVKLLMFENFMILLNSCNLLSSNQEELIYSKRVLGKVIQELNCNYISQLYPEINNGHMIVVDNYLKCVFEARLLTSCHDN